MKLYGIRNSVVDIDASLFLHDTHKSIKCNNRCTWKIAMHYCAVVNISYPLLRYIFLHRYTCCF